MADEMKMQKALQVYDTLCKAMDHRNWHYKKDESTLRIALGVNGDDIPMQLVACVDANRELISVYSPLPFKMSEGKRMEGAIAACAASFGMVDGSFDYDLSDGAISFRMTESFRESEIGEGLFCYLIDCTCAMVDRYNDRFLALDKGMLSLGEFIAKK